ncbi:hypothetical protein [Paenibacillus alvei]|uniref:hypothetical protein n=1 Tax=Paenibacillus alvei TaxID=44250 RepID=UPI002281CA42|nr:hypothetical protein [Paenibacillus alvei]MCY7482888.1 hypothetical protein [Paenibacillus alvei]
MNRVTTVMKMYSKDHILWFLAPWCFVLLPSFLINVLVGYLLKPEQGYYSGGMVSIFIYLLVLGIVAVTQTFPFAFGISIRRTDYYFGTNLMLLLSSVTVATIVMLLSISESSITHSLSANFHFFSLPYLTDGSLFEQWWTYFATAIHLCSLGFVTAIFFRRYGRMGMFILFPVMLVIFSIFSYLCTSFGWWGSIFTWFSSHSAVQLASCLFALSLLYSLLSFIMIRKTTIS